VNKPVLDKSDRILIIGEAEDETRSLVNALTAGYSISAAPNVSEAAGQSYLICAMQALILKISSRPFKSMPL
jgi:hypothetical protein